jgi:hypothetical protein
LYEAQTEFIFFPPQDISSCEEFAHLTRRGCTNPRRPFFFFFFFLLLLLTEIKLSLGGSSPYTSTDKQIGINIHKNKTIQKHSTNSTNHSKKQVHILLKHTHITKPTRTHSCTLQNRAIKFCTVASDIFGTIISVFDPYIKICVTPHAPSRKRHTPAWFTGVRFSLVHENVYQFTCTV